MAFITGSGLLSPVPFPCQENQVGWDTDQWRGCGYYPLVFG